MAAGLELLEANVTGTENVIAVGDLNCRIGRAEGCLVADELPHSGLLLRRSSLDTTTNRRGRVLLNYIDREGLVILKGRTLGDQQGSFTFTSSLGRSVIDLCFVSAPCLSLVKDFYVCASPTSSDHLPICVDLQSSHRPTNHLPKLRTQWRPELSTEFNARLRELLLLNSPDCPTDVQAHDLLTAMNTVAGELGLTRLVRPSKDPPWFSAECRSARAQLGRLTHNCKCFGFSSHSVAARGSTARPAGRPSASLTAPCCRASAVPVPLQNSGKQSKLLIACSTHKLTNQLTFSSHLSRLTSPHSLANLA